MGLIPDDGRPDLVNRDPNGLNESILIQFEDVFGEPEGAHSIECAWKTAFKCFEGGKMCCYHVLSVCCAWLCALCWGCEFACITFGHIWCLTPMWRMVEILCGMGQKLMGACFDCCLGPCMAACGMCFSNIRVQQK